MNDVITLEFLAWACRYYIAEAAIMEASNNQINAAWNQPCSDEHLHELSLLIDDWRELVQWLGLTTVDEQDTSVLMTWKQLNGDQATYKRLSDAFTSCSRLDLVNKISELLRAEEWTISTCRSTGEPTCIRTCTVQ